MNTNLAYQDDAWEKRREEVIDGEVVMMSPRPAVNHNRVASNINFIFERYLRGKKCTPFSDGTDLFLDDKNRFVPDFMVVCDRDKIKWNGVHGAPDLVVEVLSPGTAMNDRRHKKDTYEKNGIPEYWIVSPKERTVEVYLLKQGQYDLDNIYTLFHDWELERLTDAEKAALVTEFKCHLYDDLVILLEDIFYDLL